MKEITGRVSARGQVTIPIEVRRLLGVEPSDLVVFRIEDGEVRLVPAEFTLETTFASVMPLQRPEDFEQRIRDAKEEKAERTGSRPGASERRNATSGRTHAGEPAGLPVKAAISRANQGKTEERPRGVDGTARPPGGEGRRRN